MKNRFVLVIFGCALLANAGAQDSVPVSTEEIMVNHVDEEHARAVALLEKSVNINSGSMNFAGIKVVGALLAPEFEELGFTTEWIDGAPFRRHGPRLDHQQAVRRVARR